MKALSIAAASLSLPLSARADVLDWLTGGSKKKPTTPPPTPLSFTPESNAPASLMLTPEDKVTGYNNFYELGLDKADPAANAGGLRREGWKIQIEGKIARPVTLDIYDIIKRFRCVEAWSMMIPWVGFPLVKLIQFVEPTSAARYVAF